MAGFSPNEEIELFEEIKFEPSVMCEPIDKKLTFRSSQLEDGDIICYQKSPPAASGDQGRHPGVPSKVTKADKQLSPSSSGRFQQPTHVDKSLIKVDIPDIVSVSACADLTLPAGAGLCVDIIHGAVYLVADTWKSLNGWQDAIRLVYTIFARGKTDVLAGIITG